MASQFSFEIVGPEEDQALRSILRRTFMEGPLSLSLQREPNFFLAEAAGNLESEVIGARDIASGRLIGLACRAVRKLYVDGEARTVGYLSGLRGLAPYRSGALLARGYQYLKRLHQDGKVPFYVTTILDNNHYAKEMLTSRRAGLPVYLPLGRIFTYLLPLYKRRKRQNRGDVIRADPKVIEAGIECIDGFNRRHQFGAVYTSQDLVGQTCLLPNFDVANLYVFQAEAKVLATLGVWDQSAFKQYVVADYAGPYQWLRHISGPASVLGLAPKLPRIGHTMSYLQAAFLSHVPDEFRALEALVKTCLEDWQGRGYSYLAVGVHERNPLTSVFEPLTAMKLSSTMYIVYWEDLMRGILPSPEPVPHLEVATL